MQTYPVRCDKALVLALLAFAMAASAMGTILVHLFN